jgi:ribosomal-protein-alanine N-acetyltransferase
MLKLFTIRPARPEDLEAMYALDHLCFEEPFRFTWSTMRRFAARADAIALVAEAGVEPTAGLAGFVIVHVDRRDRSAYVVTLDVHPDRRRRGIAHTLLAEAERLAHEAGARSMHLHVYTGNGGAISFYDSRGYVRQTLEPDLYATGVDAWTCVKALG